MVEIIVLIYMRYLQSMCFKEMYHNGIRKRTFMKKNITKDIVGHISDYEIIFL